MSNANANANANSNSRQKKYKRPFLRQTSAVDKLTPTSSSPSKSLPSPSQTQITEKFVVRMKQANKEDVEAMSRLSNSNSSSSSSSTNKSKSKRWVNEASEPCEMATDIKATSTTKLTLFHSFVWLASLGAARRDPLLPSFRPQQ